MSLSIFWWNGTPQCACFNAIIKPQMYKEISGRITLNRIKNIPSERWTIVRGINKGERWESKSHCFSNCNQQVLLLKKQNAWHLHLPRFGSLRCGAGTYFKINIATIMAFLNKFHIWIWWTNRTTRLTPPQLALQPTLSNTTSTLMYQYSLLIICTPYARLI